MLNSQRRINVRNNPVGGPSVIKTKTEWENNYTPAYEALMGAQMESEAKAYRSALQERTRTQAAKWVAQSQAKRLSRKSWTLSARRNG